MGAHAVCIRLTPLAPCRPVQRDKSTCDFVPSAQRGPLDNKYVRSLVWRQKWPLLGAGAHASALLVTVTQLPRTDKRCGQGLALIFATACNLVSATAGHVPLHRLTAIHTLHSMAVQLHGRMAQQPRDTMTSSNITMAVHCEHEGRLTALLVARPRPWSLASCSRSSSAASQPATTTTTS